MTEKKIVLANGKKIITQTAFVVGIINRTPDSFFCKDWNLFSAVEHALNLGREGADILDIGGESTRPGSYYIEENEEISRIVPLIREIRKKSSIPISVDTRKKNVLAAALNEGADILNDVSALCDDEKMAEFVAQKKIPVILMHKNGIPSIMQKEIFYNDFFAEVNGFLKNRVNFALKSGIEKQKIILDPGVGFGKNVLQNFSLLNDCKKFLGGEFLVLVGVSRKSFLGKILKKNAKKLLSATIAANLVAVSHGADLLRVHDVEAARDSLKIFFEAQKIAQSAKNGDLDECV